MQDVRKLKVWPQLKAAGYTRTTYRFRGVVTGYGAALYRDRCTLIDTRPLHAPGKKRWEVAIDPAQLESTHPYILCRESCKGQDILSTIEKLKAGKVHIRTRYDKLRGQVPEYAPYTYPG